jgi:aminopeptidase
LENRFLESSFGEKFAKQIVAESMRISKGESVYIWAVREALDLAEAIAIECDIVGAKPLINAYSDGYMKRALTKAREEYVEATPKHMLSAFESTDVYIGLGRPALAEVPVSKIGAWRRSRKPISDKLDEKKIRWLGVTYPTPGRARESGISLKKFSDIVFSSLDIDYKKLVEKGRNIVDRVSDSENVIVTSDKGTDLEFQVKNRKWIIDDGVISQEDIELGDVGLNLPCGEVFVCPLEETAEGTILFDVPTNYWGHKITDLRLQFKNGRIVNYDAKTGKKEFADTLAAATGDKDKIAEFAIGLNPKAQFINDSLVDEKVLGTIHIAIGDNKGPAYGGKNSSSIHWDLIMTHPTVEIGGKTIMENGKLKV